MLIRTNPFSGIAVCSGRGGTQTKKKKFSSALEIGNGNIQDTVKLQTGVPLQGKLSIMCRFIAFFVLVVRIIVVYRVEFSGLCVCLMKILVGSILQTVKACECVSVMFKVAWTKLGRRVGGKISIYCEKKCSQTCIYSALIQIKFKFVFTVDRIGLIVFKNVFPCLRSQSPKMILCHFVFITLTATFRICVQIIFPVCESHEESFDRDLLQ